MVWAMAGDVSTHHDKSWKKAVQQFVRLGGVTNLSEKLLYLEQISVIYVKKNIQYQLMPFRLRMYIFK